MVKVHGLLKLYSVRIIMVERLCNFQFKRACVSAFGLNFFNSNSIQFPEFLENALFYNNRRFFITP